MNSPVNHVHGQRAAATMARSFADLGVEHVVVSPGSRNTPLVLALDAEPRFKVQVVLDERSAAFTALGIARATGKAALLSCTSGSAGAHYLAAMVEARESRLPMIAITADRPGELQHCGAPQTTQQRHMLASHATAVFQLPTPDADVSTQWLRNVIGQAVLATQSGPVHINAPFRKPLYQRDETPPALSMAKPRLRRGRLELATQELTELAQQLSQVDRGLLVVGPESSASSEAVFALAKRLHWPVIADPLSGLRFGPHASSDLLLARADIFLRQQAEAQPQAPQCVLYLGRPCTSKWVMAFLQTTARDRVMLLNEHGDWRDGGGLANELIVAQPEATLVALAEGLAEHRPSSQQRAFASQYCNQEERAAKHCQTAHSPSAQLWEGAVAQGLIEAMTDECQLHVASSMPIRDIDAFGGTSNFSLRLRANRGCNGIDGTLATAIGAAIARPELRSYALVGDLAFAHDMSSLLGRSQVPLCIVCVDNNGGGIFTQLPIAEHPTCFENYFLTPQTFSPADMCASLGCAFEAIHSLAELTQALAKPCDKLRILWVKVDRKHSVERRRSLVEGFLAQPSLRDAATGAAR
jgi:2-succinyl-5-enolpyruvyl-6-hydroxy-3-cyclohexene-1-carboxylate synthase